MSELYIDNFFDDIEEGELIRISSGEGYWPVTEALESKLRKASDIAHTKIIIGPVISVDDEHERRQDGNAYIRMAKDGKAELYCPPCRQRFHYTIKGGKAVLKENYHIAQTGSEHREISLVNDPLIVNTYIRDYDLSIEVFGMKPITKDNLRGQFIYLKREEIEQLMASLNAASPEELGLKYDFLCSNEIIDRLKHLKIFKDEMLNS